MRVITWNRNVTLDRKKLVFTIRKPFDTITNVKGFPILLCIVDDFRTYFQNSNEYFNIPNLTTEKVEI